MLRIVVCTDESAHSLRVLPHAGLLARHCQADLCLLEVVRAADLDSEAAEASTSAVDQRQAFLRRQLENAGVGGECVVAVRADDEAVPDAVLEAARRQGAGLIVMDTEATSTIHRLVHSSDTLAVVRKADVPVLTSGPRLMAPPAGEEYRVLLTYDGSPVSAAAADAIRPIVAAGGLRVTALSVLQPVRTAALAANAVAEREAELRALAGRLGTDARVDVKVVEIPPLGGVDTAIIEAAESLDVHAIAMATHGSGGGWHALLGSTAVSILGRSPVPVLLVRSAQGGK
jgi:nucleotide-binding universal stress UspA family protein